MSIVRQFLSKNHGDSNTPKVNDGYGYGYDMLLAYTYEEGAQPEEFFVPYIWTLMVWIICVLCMSIRICWTILHISCRKECLYEMKYCTFVRNTQHPYLTFMLDILIYYGFFVLFVLFVCFFR